MTSVGTSVEKRTIEARVAAVGRNLADSFSGVLNAIPGAPHRPQWLAKQLGVNAVLTSRLLSAAQQHDPIAVAHGMPGPEPLRRLLKAAEKKKVDRTLIRQAMIAVDQFQDLINAEAGDRLALDAIISGWLPDARQKIELIAKQSIFRGVSQVLGTACDVETLAAILYPNSEDPSRADQVWLSATQRLRRVRPGLPVNYYTLRVSAVMQDLKGKPSTDLRDSLLEPFCTTPLPELKAAQAGEYVNYMLEGDQVGVRSAVDLTHASLLPRHKPLFRSTTQNAAEFTVGMGTPSRTLVFDVLLHKDIYPRQEPMLNIYRTVGVFRRDSTAHDEMNRLNLVETVQPLGAGLANFRSADAPQYQDMIRFICDARGWDSQMLRGYRCRIDYPMYSSEITMSFDLPEARGN